MVIPFRQQLEMALSVDRIESYRPLGGTDLEMLSTYFWNIELCESLYPPLGALEKAFRNTLSNSLAVEFNRLDWYGEPRFLQKREAMAIFGTKFDLEKEGKEVTPGRIISRQDFGFWTGLFSRGYGVWSDNYQAATVRAFPHAPPSMRYRGRLLDHFNQIRQFRNRIFHYESILNGIVLPNGNNISLPQMHQNIVDALYWINPTYHDVIAKEFDRFTEVHSTGISGPEMKLKRHLRLP